MSSERPVNTILIQHDLWKFRWITRRSTRTAYFVLLRIKPYNASVDWLLDWISFSGICFHGENWHFLNAFGNGSTYMHEYSLFPRIDQHWQNWSSLWGIRVMGREFQFWPWNNFRCKKVRQSTNQSKYCMVKYFQVVFFSFYFFAAVPEKDGDIFVQ